MTKQSEKLIIQVVTDNMSSVVMPETVTGSGRNGVAPTFAHSRISQLETIFQINSSAEISAFAIASCISVLKMYLPMTFESESTPTGVETDLRPR